MSDYVCEELIVEIFIRLPPKSLLRLRSLSKSWLSCISSPRFIRMHKHPQKFLIRHIVRDPPKGFGDKEVYTLHSEEGLPLCPRGYSGIPLAKFRLSDIVGSCNGILCLIDYGEHISLWNPSIRCKLTLPACPPQGHYWVVGTGFGFDPTTDDYKIVRLPYGRTKERSFVYATKIGAWCEIPSPTTLFYFVSQKACFVNGSLHWVVHSASDEGDPFYILTFDLSTHVFGMISLPKHGDSRIWKFSRLTIIQGSLAVYGTRFGDNRSWYDRLIWVRKGASWSLVFESKAYEISYRIMQVIVHGDLLLLIYYDRVEVHNYKRGAQSRLVNFNDASRISGVLLFSESLELLDMGTACKRSQLFSLKEKKKKIT